MAILGLQIIRQRFEVRGRGSPSGQLFARDPDGNLIEFIRPVPSLALLPIFIVWFGIGELTKTIFITYSAFFIIFVATLEAIRDVDPVLKRAAGSMGMSPRQMAYHVTFKSVLPQIMVSIRLALATSWFVRAWSGSTKGWLRWCPPEPLGLLRLSCLSPCCPPWGGCGGVGAPAPRARPGPKVGKPARRRTTSRRLFSFGALPSSPPKSRTRPSS